MAQSPVSLTAREFQSAQGVEHWRALSVGVSAWFGAPSHSAGATLTRRIVTASAELGCLTPHVEIRSTGVQVRIAPDEGNFTEADVALARGISVAASELGLTADPSVPQDVQLTFDALDQSAVMPFWATVLGYDLLGEDDLVDPLRRHPSIWFQDQDAPRPLRNRVHLDAVAPQPAAAQALASVRERGASVAEHGYYATVADAEGNEADILPLPEGAGRWGGAELEDWRVVFAAMACYPVSSTDQALDLIDGGAALADQSGLPLGLDLRPGLVVLDTGKDTWEQDEGYAALAAQVQQAARGLGLRADPSLGRFVQVGIDAVDVPAVRTFWAAALAYQEDPREGVTDLFDPRRLNTVVFFQPMEAEETERRAQRNRIHVDVFLPEDQAGARVEAALAAGGRVVRESHAPTAWTIADPEGNEVDITYSVGREELFRSGPTDPDEEAS